MSSLVFPAAAKAAAAKAAAAKAAAAKAAAAKAKTKGAERTTLVCRYKQLLEMLCDMRKKVQSKGHVFFVNLFIKMMAALHFKHGDVYFANGIILKVSIRKGYPPQLHLYGFWSQILDLFKAVCPGICLDTPPSESEISDMIKANTQLFVNGLKKLQLTKVGCHNKVTMSNRWLIYVNDIYDAIIAKEEGLYGEEAMLKERAAADAGGSAADGSAGGSAADGSAGGSAADGSDAGGSAADAGGSAAAAADPATAALDRQSAAKRAAIKCAAKRRTKHQSDSTHWGDEDVDQ
jgi:hypothetical protein